MKKTFTLLVVTALLSGCSGDYVASVSGDKITKKDFLTYLDVKGIRYDDISTMDGALKGLASKIALEKAIVNEGIKGKEKIDAEVAEYRRNLIVNQYFENYINTTVTDDSVLNYYNNNVDEFEEEKAHIAHILMRTNSGMPDEELQAIKTRTYEIYSRLKKGESFEALAGEVSADTISAKKGGDLGWVKKGFLSPIFSKTAFILAANEVSEPIQTEFGFHIIKALESPKIIKRSFDSMSGEIRHMLKSKVKQEKLNQLMSSVSVELKELKGE